MKRALLAVGAALLLGAATFTTSIITASSADARPRGMSSGGAKFYGGGGTKFYSGGPGKVYGGGKVYSGGPVKYSGVKYGGPGKVYFNKPGKHPRFVKHRFHRPFFVGAALYSYGYYDECVRWHPAYGWINVCYPYDY